MREISVAFPSPANCPVSTAATSLKRAELGIAQLGIVERRVPALAVAGHDSKVTKDAQREGDPLPPGIPEMDRFQDFFQRQVDKTALSLPASRSPISSASEDFQFPARVAQLIKTWAGATALTTEHQMPQAATMPDL